MYRGIEAGASRGAAGGGGRCIRCFLDVAAWYAGNKCTGPISDVYCLAALISQLQMHAYMSSQQLGLHCSVQRQTPDS